MTELRESRHVRTADLLPPPPIGKALGFGAAAAIAGSVVWGLLIIYGRMEIGWLAIGIGALIGFAIVKAGGHGTLLMVSAGVLALLSILSGKNISYRAEMAEVVEMINTEQYTPASHALMAEESAEWVTLGDDPTDEQVRAYAEKYDYSFINAAKFVSTQGLWIRRFAAERPSLEVWHTWTADQVSASYSFTDSLRDNFHPMDILFVVIGISAALGMVSRATTDMQSAERERLRAERHAAEAEAAAAEEGQTSGPAPE